MEFRIILLVLLELVFAICITTQNCITISYVILKKWESLISIHSAFIDSVNCKWVYNYVYYFCSFAAKCCWSLILQL